MLTFGNFRALPVGATQRAYVQDDKTGEVKYLAIEGAPFEFVDIKIVDVPMIPTMWWMNWALAKGKVICASIQEQTQRENVIKLNVQIKLEGTLGPIILFSSSNYRESYRQEISNFILTFSYGATSAQTSILAHFKGQTPIE